MLCVDPRLNRLCNGAEHPVGKQNTQEGAYKGGSDLGPNIGGGTANRAHCNYNTKYGGYNPESRQRIRHFRDRCRYCHGLVMVLVEVKVQHLGEMMIFNGASEKNLERVAQERDGVFVMEKTGKLPEQCTIPGIFNMLFKPNEAILSGRLKDDVQDLQEFAITGRIERRGLQECDHCSKGTAKGPWRIANDERTDGRATNDDELIDLHKHTDLPMVHDIATNDAPEDDYKPDNKEHVRPTDIIR